LGPASTTVPTAQTDNARRVFGQGISRDHPPLSCSPRRLLPPALPASTRRTCSRHPCATPLAGARMLASRATAVRPPATSRRRCRPMLLTNRHLRSTCRTCSHRPCTLPPLHQSGGEAVHSSSHSYHRAPTTPLVLAIITVPRPPSTAASGAPPAPSTPPVASPELGGALQPHQPRKRQLADPLTSASLRPTAITAVSPPW
jgi:hypothetical protein